MSGGVCGVSVVATQPYAGQKPGTSGLRKAVKVPTKIAFYMENRLSSIVADPGCLLFIPDP
jgi:phosphoglucomutase